MIAGVALLTPWGLLLWLALIPVVWAVVHVARRNARGRKLLGLASPRRSDRATLAAVAAVPFLLGVAGGGPALRTHTGRTVRTDAQAMFVFDTSRSMAASASFASPTRFALAQSAAIKLRAAIADVPSGVASFTTEVIPHLFPTPDAAAFNSTVVDAIGIERPPPPFFKFGVSGTSFGPLALLRNQGFFMPSIKHRYAVVLTDGETGPFDPAALHLALSVSQQRSVFPGRIIPAIEPPVELFVLRVGSSTDRIYRNRTSVEAAYRPDPRGPHNASDLAAATGGRSYDGSDLSAAVEGLRHLVGEERGAHEGLQPKTTNLAPYVVLLALLPLAVILRRRNLVAI